MATGASSCEFCGAALETRNYALPGHRPMMVTLPCRCPKAVEEAERAERERVDAERAEAFRAAWKRAGIPAEFAHVDADFSRADALCGHRSVYVTGRSGRGKTRLACQAVKGYLIRGIADVYGSVVCTRSAWFIQWQEVTSQIRSSWHRWDQTEEDVFQRLVGVSLLVLDDVGKGVPGEWDAETLWRIIDARWASHRSVVITSQYDTKALAERYAKAGGETLEALLSRLRGWCEGVVLDGPDRRLA